MPDARDCTASGVRPIFKPITRVGVFWDANCLSVLLSLGVHDLPWFFGCLAMLFFLAKQALSPPLVY